MMAGEAKAYALRWLATGNAAAFQTLRLGALQEAPSAFGSSYPEEKDEPLHAVAERLQPAPGRGIIGAWAGEQLVGTLGFRRKTSVKQGHQAIIWGVYVAPQQRGQGIAQAMLNEALQFAQQQNGLLQIHLGVTTTNTPALRMYEGAGFRIYGTEPAALCVDGQLLDEYLMVLHLASDT